MAKYHEQRGQKNVADKYFKKAIDNGLLDPEIVLETAKYYSRNQEFVMAKSVIAKHLKKNKKSRDGHKMNFRFSIQKLLKNAKNHKLYGQWLREALNSFIFLTKHNPSPTECFWFAKLFPKIQNHKLVFFFLVFFRLGFIKIIKFGLNVNKKKQDQNHKICIHKSVNI